MRPGKRRVLGKTTPAGKLMTRMERLKAGVRVKVVGHPFQVIKRPFCFVKCAIVFWLKIRSS